MLLSDLSYVAGVTFPDKVQHFGLSSVGQTEEVLNSKVVDESVECFNEPTLVDLS